MIAAAALVILTVAATAAVVAMVAACTLSGQIDTKQAALLEAHDADTDELLPE